MFKLCHSIQIVTEHKHYYEKEVTLTRKRKNRDQPTNQILASQILTKTHQPQTQLDFYQSIYSCPDINSTQHNAKGISLTYHPNLPSTTTPHNKQPYNQHFAICHLISKQPLQHHLKRPQISQPKMGYSPTTYLSPQKQKGIYLSSSHNPHPLLTKKKPLIHSLEKITKIQQLKDLGFQKDLKQINGSIYIYPKQQGKTSMTMASYEYPLQRTKKKEHQYNCKHSQETLLNHQSEVQTPLRANLKQLEIQSDPPTITIHPCQIKPANLGDLPSPHKIKKQLEDAKSIISRDESTSRLEDVKLEESILLKREIDMFDFITPVGEITICEMAKAIDRRYNTLVTLKIFRQEESPYQQLEIIRRIELSREPNTNILKFLEIFMEDTFAQKKIIFVFEAMKRTLKEHIDSIKLNPAQMKQFLYNLREQMFLLVQILNSLDLEMVNPLHLDDFVVTQEGCKFHNISKLSGFKPQQTRKKPWEVIGPVLKQLEDSLF